MLLDELRKYTPESHVDYDTIRQALELIRDTADTVNNVAKLAEQQRKVRKSSGSLALSYWTPRKSWSARHRLPWTQSLPSDQPF